ncbi:hypothetical protein FGO68_gene1883 [Halteria grandinella]|uniref:Uncharacterized protein n=1 Tax=Halteria grandinella TaxID=5974 RepID=A0A8J8NBQ1_HALGN|nr:hypothetical protein FGO68_gene1883 [Halteria grandinella]
MRELVLKRFQLQQQVNIYILKFIELLRLQKFTDRAAIKQLFDCQFSRKLNRIKDLPELIEMRSQVQSLLLYSPLTLLPPLYEDCSIAKPMQKLSLLTQSQIFAVVKLSLSFGQCKHLEELAD